MVINSTEIGGSRTKAAGIGKSCSEHQLRRLLDEIAETARDHESPAWMKSDLRRLRAYASGLDDSGAEMLVTAIQLGEEFASLYFRGLLGDPPYAWQSDLICSLPADGR